MAKKVVAKYRAVIEYVVYEGEGTLTSEKRLWRDEVTPFLFPDSAFAKKTRLTIEKVE